MSDADGRRDRRLQTMSERGEAMATATPITRRHRPWRLSVNQYLRMIEVGIITEQDRVFLWKGRLFEKMTKARPHTTTTMRLNTAQGRVVAGHPYYVEKEEAMMLIRRTDTIPE